MTWGLMAQIKELEEQIERLKGQLRISGELAFHAGWRAGVEMGWSNLTAAEAWEIYKERKL